MDGTYVGSVGREGNASRGRICTRASLRFIDNLTVYTNSGDVESGGNGICNGKMSGDKETRKM